MDTSHLTPAQKVHLKKHWTTPASTEDAHKLFGAFESKYRACLDLLGQDGNHSVLMVHKGWLLEEGVVMTWAMEQWLNWKLSELKKEDDYYEQKVCKALNAGFLYLAKSCA